jgi:photosystem II stability/assembly factor-like uncharacterized protein
LCFRAFLSFLSYGQWITHNSNYLTVNDAHIVNSDTSYVVISQGDFGGTSISRLTSKGSKVEVMKSIPSGLYKGCHFFDSKRGLICGSGAGGAFVWATNDGGATLNPIQIATPNVPYPTDFSFVDNTTGFLYATSPVSGSKIFKTTNGGMAWQLVKEEDIFIYDFKFLTATKGFRLTAAGLEKSVDAAATWTKINTPKDIRSFFFSNENTGYVGDGEGQLFKTTNGGTTWTIVSRFANLTIENIKFPTPLVGYVVGGGNKDYVFRTTDGGTTWRTVYGTAQELQGINKIEYLNENTLAAVGLGVTAYANNASTTADLGLSTLFVSGNDTSCNPKMKLRFDLTGKAPWDITLIDNKFAQKKFTATNSPFFVDFAPPSLNDDGIYKISAQLVKGSNETVSDIAGGQAELVSLPYSAYFADNRIEDTLCLDVPIQYSINLEGCAPWSLKILDQGKDTIVENIQSSPFIYKTIFTGVQGSNSIEIKAVRSRNQAYSYDLRSGLTKYLYSKAPRSSINISVDNPYFCNNTEGVLSSYFMGLPPYTYTLSNGIERITETNYSISPDIRIPIKRAGLWKFTSAKDGCGDIKTLNSVQVYAKDAPNIPTNIRYQYTPEGDSIQVTWSDNNVLSETKIWINNNQHIYDLGVQKGKISVYEIFLNNADTGIITLRANIRENIFAEGCSVYAPDLILPSILKTIKRQSYNQTPPGTGVVLADMNNDNLPDVLAANGFYINKGGFQFEFRAQDFRGTPIVVGDMDNDGDLDFLVNNLTDKTTKIYYNNGNFNFTLKQTVQGINASLFDYDFNGLLDIAANGGFYRNAGDNRYILEPSLDAYPGIKGRAYYHDIGYDGMVDVIDSYNDSYDYNGYMSFKMIRYDTSLNYWRHDQNIESGNYVAKAQSISFADVNGRDGFEDFFAFSSPYYETRHDGSSARYITYFFRTAPYGFVSSFTGPEHRQNDFIGRGEGVTFDMDNNCDIEVIDGGNIAIDPYFGREFEGYATNYLSNGYPAVADFDNDGDLDIAVALPQGGMDIFENKFELKNNWLKVKLNGRTINKSGLGTAVKIVYKDKKGNQRIVRSSIGGKIGGTSQSDILAHFGLCKTTIIDEVSVIWRPGKETILRGVSPNQTLTIDEPFESIRPSYPLELKVVNVNNQAKLTWKDVATNEKGYIIQRSLTSVDTGFVTLDTVPQNSMEYLTVLSNNAFYRILAYNLAAHSAYSNVARLNTPSICALNIAVDTFYISPEKGANDCSGLVKLAVPQISGLQYQWLLNDVSLNASTNTFNASKSGNYGLIVKNTEGCIRRLADVKIAVAKDIKPELKVKSEGGCAATSATLSAYPKDKDFNYVIQYFDNDTYNWETLSDKDSVEIKKGGNFRVMVQHKIAACSFISPQVSLALGDSLIIAAEADNPVGCNTPVILTNLDSLASNIKYYWLNKNDSIVSRANVLTLTKASESGTYTLYGKDTISGCYGHSAPINVSFLFPKATYKVDSINCLGDKGQILVILKPNEIGFIEKDYGGNSWGAVEQNIPQTDSFKLDAGIYRVTSRINNIVGGCIDISPNIIIRDTSMTISGKILLPNGTPSVSSPVRLLKVESSTTHSQVASTTTDNKGIYQFKPTVLGDYKILALGNNQPTVLPTYNGDVTNYTLAKAIQANDCKVYPSDIKLVSTTPTSDFNSIFFNVEIKENPFSTFITLDIQSEKAEIFTFELINLNGSVIQKWQYPISLSQNILTLQPTDLTSGMYFLKVVDSKGIHKILKVIKI